MYAIRSYYEDAAGNVSASKSASVTVTLPDTTAPVVGTFTLPATSTSLTIAVSALTASDNVAVTGYMLTESDIAPDPADAGWNATAPTYYTFAVAEPVLFRFCAEAYTQTCSGPSPCRNNFV